MRWTIGAVAIAVLALCAVIAFAGSRSVNDPHAAHRASAREDDVAVSAQRQSEVATTSPQPGPQPGRTTKRPEVREERRAAVDVSPEQQVRIGLATRAAARHEHVRHAIRAVGSIVADQRREAHVHTRIAGWIDDISVSAVGEQVARGQVLYRLYAPEIVATQQELVVAGREGDLGRRIADAALERLSLWGVAPSEIDALKNGGAPKRALAFLAPVGGHVIDKSAVKGAYVTPDMELYRIADLSKVWVLVSLYENELPLVAIGDVAEVTIAGFAGATVRAPVTFVYPELDTATRTGTARIEIENKKLAFKPGMYADVTISKDLGAAVVVPEDAIIFTGARNLVFKKTSATRFMPVEVSVGPRVEGTGRIILAGVDAGDEVVVRASFLVDAESRLQAALQAGGTGTGGAGGHAGHGSGG